MFYKKIFSYGSFFIGLYCWHSLPDWLHFSNTQTKLIIHSACKLDDLLVQKQLKYRIALRIAQFQPRPKFSSPSRIIVRPGIYQIPKNVSISELVDIFKKGPSLIKEPLQKGRLLKKSQKDCANLHKAP